ncbi:MAG: aldehyde dehydrogenase family protein [Cellulosilyticaceae bacterium]
MKDLTDQIQYMHRFFHSKRTYDLKFRRFYLKKLRKQIFSYEQALITALYLDLHKPAAEVYRTELFTVLDELDYTLRHMGQWVKPTTRPSRLPLLGSFSSQIPEPYGVCSIFVPYNYPFQLAFSPLIGAIAAGNCVILKLSEYTPHTNKVIQNLVRDTFPNYLVDSITGNVHTARALLKQPLDYIFFTGSTEVGKEVMAAASHHLIPITLELGGKNPTLVDYTADLDLAAKRIAWGKFMNGGQTCVAPDYILIHESVAEAFLVKLREAIHQLYPDPTQMTHIINEKHFVRLMNCINEDTVIMGGHFESHTHFIEPTVLYPTSLQDNCMQDEIFGPILPVIPFTKLQTAFQTINRFPKPLATYIFSEDKLRIEYMLRHITFGGGCINDTIMHLTDLNLPFGGIGYSGLGAYHGYASFKTFSHYKSVLSSSKLELPMRYGHSPCDVKALKYYMNLRFKG